MSTSDISYSAAAGIVAKYPELSPRLNADVEFFRSRFGKKFSTLDECRTFLKPLAPKVWQLFPEVQKLLRLLLISLASSCEAERTFSAYVE